MKGHGWDKYKEEGVIELSRIKSSKFFFRELNEKSREALIHLIEKYIEFYGGDGDLHAKIEPDFFYPELFELTARKKAKKTLLEKAAGENGKLSLLQKPAEDKATKIYLEQAKKNKNLKRELKQPARDKASRNIAILRQVLKDFYKTEEGIQSEYRIYFLAEERDYKLGIRKADDLNDRQETSDFVSYSERKHFEASYSRILLELVFPISFGVTLVLLLVVIITYFAVPLRSPYSLLMLLASAVITVIGIVELQLIRLPRKRFIFLIWRKYFLTLSDRKIFIKTYSAKCPLCGGNVELAPSLVGWKGYVSKCEDYPEYHVFKFDPYSLSGRRIH